MKKQITIELKPEQIFDDKLIKTIAARNCRIRESEITCIDYIKRSLDSRRSKPRFVLVLDVFINEPLPLREKNYIRYKTVTNDKRVIIIGAGPAGYFAALELLEFGIKPIIFERGKDVRARRIDLREIMQNGTVNSNSNYSFGEGGAGAYSDGKLYTRSNKRGNIKKVLQILVEHGAAPDILIDAHPHIGSNKLPKIISNIRETIIKHGGEVHFNSLVTDFIIKKDKVTGVIVNNSDEYSGNAVLLASGHSARDIFSLLHKKDIFIESKPFAVGLRIEHFQKLINDIQYGKRHSEELPPASYNLTAQVGDRGVFSFCMCPGGLIVPSVTAPRELVVNGMSMSGRNSIFANSGIVTTVNERDFVKFKSSGPLAGMKYQEYLEQKFYTGDSENPLKAPAQRLIDFIENKNSSSLNVSSYIPGLISAELNRMFPKKIAECLQTGLRSFGFKMKGFLTLDSNVIGLESRTSSPVRITRHKDSLAHIGIQNLFPCGEGAGYAGGIVSSAVDGQNSAKAVAEQIF